MKKRQTQWPIDRKVGITRAVCSYAAIPAAQKLNTFTVHHWVRRQNCYLQQNEDESQLTYYYSPTGRRSPKGRNFVPPLPIIIKFWLIVSAHTVLKWRIIVLPMRTKSFSHVYDSLPQEVLCMLLWLLGNLIYSNNVPQNFQRLILIL